MDSSEVKPAPAAQPLYPHTLAQPSDLPGVAEVPSTSVDIDALASLYARSTSAVLYLDRELTETDRQAVLERCNLIAEFDAVRGVDTLRAS